MVAKSHFVHTTVHCTTFDYENHMICQIWLFKASDWSNLNVLKNLIGQICMFSGIWLAKSESSQASDWSIWNFTNIWLVNLKLHKHLIGPIWELSSVWLFSNNWFQIWAYSRSLGYKVQGLVFFWELEISKYSYFVSYFMFSLDPANKLTNYRVNQSLLKVLVKLTFSKQVCMVWSFRNTG